MPEFKHASFRFNVEPFRGTRSSEKRLEIMYALFERMSLEGPVDLKSPDETFTVFEHWQLDSVPLKIENPEWIYLGRFVGSSSRDIIHKYDLKKRDYISRTSMDAELALITANMALAAPGKLFYDPFAGTGSFPVACAHFGAVAWGSDIDGRSMRGEGGKKSLMGNFQQYGLRENLGDAFVADLTHSPLRKARILDGIVCDPPYGVREGLLVLGWKDPSHTEEMIKRSMEDFRYVANKPKAHTSRPTLLTHLRPFPIFLCVADAKNRRPDYVPPKKPYSFVAMLDDILVFATEMLVDDGRLSFWMPTANDEEQDIPIPTHPSLELVSLCVQAFYKCRLPIPVNTHASRYAYLRGKLGSRRLITYRRIPDSEISPAALEAYANRQRVIIQGRTADDFNPFRANYFNGFRTDKQPEIGYSADSAEQISIEKK